MLSTRSRARTAPAPRRRSPRGSLAPSTWLLVAPLLAAAACELPAGGDVATIDRGQPALLEDGFRAVLGPMGRCLGASSGAAAGATVDLADCAGSGRTDQRWKLDGALLRSAANQSLCLTAEGSALRLRSCSTARNDQAVAISGYLRFPKLGVCVQGWDTATNPWTLACPSAAEPPFTWRWFMATSYFKVPIQVIKLVNDDGSDPVPNPLTATVMRAAVTRATALYSRAGIELTFDPAKNWTIRRDTALNNHPRWNDGKADLDSFERLTRPIVNQHPRSVVVFIAAVTGGTSFSMGPNAASPSDLVALSPGVTSETTTFRVLSHEVGHYFGLSHTFPGYENRAETEKAIAGLSSSAALALLDADAAESDDTPADVTWTGQASCTSDLTLSLGSGGSVPLRPDRFNMMSYWGCSPDDHMTISPGQARVLRDTVRWRLTMPIAPLELAGTQLPDGRTVALGSDPTLQIVGRQKTTADASAPWTVWDFHKALGGTAHSLAAAQLADGRPEIFAALGSKLLTWWWTGSAWSDAVAFDLPAGRAQRLAAATSNGVTYVFATDLNGALYQRHKLAASADAGWTAWTQVATTGGHAIAAMSVGALPGGALQLVYATSSRDTFAIWQDASGAWFGPVAMNLGGVTDVDVGRLSDGRLQLFAVVDGGEIKTAFKVDATRDAGWSAWQSLRAKAESRFTSLATLPLSNGATQLLGVRDGRVLTSYLTNAADPTSSSEWYGF